MYFRIHITYYILYDLYVYIYIWKNYTSDTEALYFRYKLESSVVSLVATGNWSWALARTYAIWNPPHLDDPQRLLLNDLAIRSDPNWASELIADK